MTGYHTGQRVLLGAITPCGQCEPCLGGQLSQCHGALGGWRLGNTIDGCQAEFVRVPYAQANLAIVPDDLTDEDVLLLADIASTGFAAAESGGVRLGDSVAVFAQGPIGLCATLGAKLMGAGQILAVDPDPFRLRMAQRLGATELIPAEEDVVGRISKLTLGRGVDVAIEAVGLQETFENATGGAAGWHPVMARGVMARGLCRASARAVGGHWRGVERHPHRNHVVGKAYDLFASRRENVLKIAIHV